MLVSSCGATSGTQVVSGGDRVSVGSSGLSLVMPIGGGYVIKGHQEGGTKYLDEVVFGNQPPLWLVSAHVMSFPRISDWPLALLLVHGQVIAQSADGSVVIYWGSKGGEPLCFRHSGEPAHLAPGATIVRPTPPREPLPAPKQPPHRAPTPRSQRPIRLPGR